MITSQTGLDNEDGILGLSPTSLDQDHSYVQQLYNSGVIDQKDFTFWIND
jgi:hypothetical protein